MRMKILEVENLKTKVGDALVLNGLNIHICYGETIAVMGPNGSGKTSFAYTIMGNPKYQVIEGRIIYKEQDITNWKTEDRARAGIFLSFQYPVSVHGVTITQLIKTAYKNVKNEEPDPRQMLDNLRSLSKELEFDEKLLTRYVNDGFSGGEKKRLETLQYLILQPQLLILDEIDSGLDINGLITIADKINKYRSKERGIVIITHYQRILDYIKPERIYVLKGGKVVKEGDMSLVRYIESHGYEQIN
ncbi:MAG: Fe-S cluster assembly ATPase SufC [Planctomycetota bacterium]